MKILFLIRTLDKGGAERQLSYLASGLAKLGHEITVLTYYSIVNNSNNFNYRLLIDSGVKVLSVEKKSRYDILGFLYRLNTIINKASPDVVYSFLELSNIFAGLYKLLHPKVKLVWGKRSADLELSKYRFSLRVEHKLERLLSGAPDLIIANSNAGKDFMLSMGYKSNIEVVYNGISSDFVTPKQYNTKINSSNRVIVGAVGRIDYAKDYINLVESFAQAYKLHNNIELRIVGSVRNEAYFMEIKNKINMSGLENVVVFLPETDNIGEFYRQIDIFVSSSFTEGFSNVISEAMLSGLPCVVTNAGDSANLVGDAGVVVERSAPDALARGLIKLLEDDHTLMFDLGQRARDRIINRFSLENLVINTIQMLNKVI